MRKATLICLALAGSLALASCTQGLGYDVPEQCKVDIINGQPHQRPGHEDCRIASDGSGRIVLRG